MASVLPRKTRAGDVNWRVQYRVGGKLRQETFTDHKAAVQFGELVDRIGGDEARAVRLARQSTDDGIPTLRAWAAVYLNPENGYLAAVTPATAEGYRQIADRTFLPVIGDLPLDVLTAQQIARWVHYQEQQPTARGGQVAAKSVKNYHAVLSAMLEAARKAGYVPGNVAKGAKITRGETAETTFLSPAEFEAVYELLPDYARPLARFLAGTGARWGEATALTWSDVNLGVTPATVRISRAWKRGPSGSPILGYPKSRKSVRTVSLPRAVVESMLPAGDPNELVFPSPRGSGQRAWTKQFHEDAWHPAVERAALGKTPRVHDLRHSHVSWLIAQGVPLPMIQARLGHEKITTTVDTYGHLSPEAHVQMALVMDQQMLPVKDGSVQPALLSAHLS